MTTDTHTPRAAQGSFWQRYGWELVLVLAPFAVTALFWSELPERIPVHWGVDGQPDRYSDRGGELWVLPIINVLTWLLLVAVPYIDPKQQNAQMSAGAMHVVRVGTLLFMLLVHTSIMLNAIGTPVDVPTVVLMGVYALFVLIGNQMGKLRPNYFYGIRSPWTLDSEIVWVKTHRLAGRLWFFGSLLLLPTPLLLPSAWNVVILLVHTLLVCFGPLAYSYWLWKQQPRPE